MYKYGMRLRGFSIGCQPKEGFIERLDDPSGKYWDILVYERRLTDEETNHYSLDYLMSKEEVLYNDSDDFRKYVDAFAKDCGKEPIEILEYITVKAVADHYEKERSK